MLCKPADQHGIMHHNCICSKCDLDVLNVIPSSSRRLYSDFGLYQANKQNQMESEWSSNLHAAISFISSRSKVKSYSQRAYQFLISSFSVLMHSQTDRQTDIQTDKHTH